MGGISLARQYVYPLSARGLKQQIGSKAANIRFLMRHNGNVPESWVVQWNARKDFQTNEALSLTTLRKELQAIIDPQKFYAVRSSASVEDTGDYSCAGLFRSYLEIQGVDNVIKHIIRVWQSLESPEFKAYGQHVMSVDTDPQMAVIIQEMVKAKYSGVVFTKNPVTGLSEVIIEAGLGTEESQVESHRDPERWVNKWGKWTVKPEDGMLSETIAKEIINQAIALSLRYGKPIDLEWAWDGVQLSFLQIRPITGLNMPVFSNRIAREVLPGIIKPLVWSVNTQLINPSWAKILNRMTGAHIGDPNDFTKHFYYRAYFNMSIFARAFERLGMPGEALELLQGLEKDAPERPKMRPGLKMIARLPRLVFFGLSFVGILQRFNSLMKKKKPIYETLAAKMEENLDEVELLEMASRVFDETKEIAYYNIVIPLLAIMHHRLLALFLKNQGYDIRMIELEGALEVAQQYNPHHTLQMLHERYFSDLANNIENNGVLSFEQEERLSHDIEQFLKTFGHFSDSGNDFSSIPWRETPDLIRRMVAQTKEISVFENETVRFEDLNLSWFNRIVIGHLYRKTSRFVTSREQISSLYTYGYGQFRTCFVKLGEQLVESGVIKEREDVFYLSWLELSQMVESGQLTSQQSLVASRRQDMDSYRDAILPEMIIGNEQPPVVTEIMSELSGIPTSFGSYSGPARVIQGINDFEKLQEGDVLIIPYSDVGWTPLFSKAGAVVSESGGILSHSSIVAREYRIPAVVSVTGACRIEDNAYITVNGYTGEIVVH